MKRWAFRRRSRGGGPSRRNARFRYAIRMSRIAALAAVLLCAIVMVLTAVLRHPEYTPDGLAYARFAARDAGYDERAATLDARAAYERTPLMRVPRYRALVEIDPSVSFARTHIFDNRILYPWVAARLLPVTGFRAPFILNAISYVVFAAALFWLLAAFGFPWLAAALTVVAIALPLVRENASSDLTDVFAMVWWTLALTGIVRGVRDADLRWPLLVAAASVLLALTRPTPYLVVLPAFAAGIVARRWLLFAASIAGAAAFAITAVLTHAFGVREQLSWIYVNRPDANLREPESVWYRTALVSTLRYTLDEFVRNVFPLAAIVAWFSVLRLKQYRAELVVLASAAVACLAALPFNPVPSSVQRVVFLPLVPVCFAIVQCALAEAFMTSAIRRGKGGSARMQESVRRYERLPAD